MTVHATALLQAAQTGKKDIQCQHLGELMAMLCEPLPLAAQGCQL